MQDRMLKELQDTWGYTREEMDHITEIMNYHGLSCYEHGYTDGKNSMKEEQSYYGGFSYGKKYDND